MSKAQPLMNRKEKRALIRKFKHKKVLHKKHTKGAFGMLPIYDFLDQQRFKELLAKIKEK